MNPRRQLLLGAIFLVALSILGYYTLFMTDFRPFGKRYEMLAHFPQASGLRRGDSVLVAGLRQGRVKDIVFDPEAEEARRISVTLLLDEPLELRRPFRIRIEEATLLGGHNVSIDPGPAGGEPAPAGEILIGEVSASSLASLGKLLDENRDGFARVIANVDEIVAGVRRGEGVLGRLVSDEKLAEQVRDGLAKIQTTFDNAAALTQDARDGKGVIGRLFTDEDLAGKLGQIGDNLARISDDLSRFSADVREGKGVLARLASDEALSAEVDAAVRNIRAITDKINSGQGTLGQLIADGELAQRINSIAAKLDGGEGTLGKLISSEEIYQKLSQVADDLAAASQALRNAEGTLGKLVMDRDLYDEVEKAIGIVTRSLEEYREAAPVTTFTSVLFGAF